MDASGFKKWLLNVKLQDPASAGSRVSACKRIDAEYDIDSEHIFDKCKQLLELFEYSKEDQRNGLVPSHGISIDGDCYTGTATLKSSLKLYLEYKKNTKTVPKGSKGGGRFIGTYEEFIHYFAGFCKNRVNYISKKERKACKGICEYCGKKATLESAHRSGMERPVIIRNTLENHFKKSANMYEVDLDKFKKEFEDSHMPIQDHFYFLCRDCHYKYDGRSAKETITQAEMKKAVGR